MEELLQSESGKIVYRAEGGKGLVVSVKQENGKCQNQRIVYRFLKRIIDTDTNQGKTSSHCHGDLIKCIDYIKHVMMPLLDKRFIRMPKVVTVKEELINIMNKKVNEFRPEYRRNTEADPKCRFVFCIEDATDVPCSIKSCPTIAVEIKPKTGFLPLQSAQISENHRIRRRICKFQIEQQIKVKKRRWSTMSNYCPIDLFSGNVERMKSSIQELIKCPQNNLRVFWSEKVIFSQETFGDLTKILEQHHWLDYNSSSMDDENKLIWSVNDFMHVIIQALLMDAPVSEDCRLPIPQQTCFTSKSTGSSGQGHLPNGCILANILRAQMLDDLDIEGVYPLYEDIVRRVQAEGQSYIDECKLAGPYHENWLHDKSDEHAVKKLKEYLASATAKDCSIMIAFRPKFPGETADVENGIFSLNDLSGNEFLVRISVIDLDIKPMSRIPGHMKLVKDSTKNFIASQ